jgi:hypothetical protein
MTKDEQITELKERIAELEEIVYEYEENDMGAVVSETEQLALKVIHEQIEKLAMISKVDKLDKDQAKNFDTFVKDLVAIRGKMPTPKTKKDSDGSEEKEADLIALATGAVINE